MQMTADKALELVFLTFNREATVEAVMGYAMGLAGMCEAEIIQACQQAVRDCRFMPTPRELRDFVGKGNDAGARPVLAWDCAMTAVGHGSYKPIDFEDKLINATIRSMGGWPSFLSRLHGDEEKWARQEFVKTYSAYQKTPPAAESCKPLQGLGGMTSINGIVQERQPIAIEAPPSLRIEETKRTAIEGGVR
jgi:hypothetical protein